MKLASYLASASFLLLAACAAETPAVESTSDALSARLDPIPVRLADERLTTVTAQRSLREAGVRAKGQRAMVDQVAAVGILQTWLDQRRTALADTGGAADG